MLSVKFNRKGFYVIPFFASDKFQADLDKLYTSIIQSVIQTIETAYQRFYGNYYSMFSQCACTCNIYIMLIGPKQDIDEFKELIDVSN